MHSFRCFSWVLPFSYVSLCTSSSDFLVSTFQCLSVIKYLKSLMCAVWLLSQTVLLYMPMWGTGAYLHFSRTKLQKVLQPVFSQNLWPEAVKSPMPCFFMDAYIQLLVGPNTVLEDTQEVQPWCRMTAARSQSHRELSTNGTFLEAGPGGGWGRGPEQLAGVDVS